MTHLVVIEGIKAGITLISPENTSFPGKIRSRIAKPKERLGKHSQTSATPKAPRLLIPQQRERTGTVKRQDTSYAGKVRK